MSAHPSNPAQTKRLGLKLAASFGLMPRSGAWFLFALILLFITTPFVREVNYGTVIDVVLMTVVFCFGVMAVGGSRRTLIWAIFLVMPALAGRWIEHFRPGLLPDAMPITAFLIFIAFLILHFLRFILRARRVNSEVLCIAVSTYLLLVLLWSSAYSLVGQLIPGSFSGTHTDIQSLRGFEAIYFSTITLTTVGYGDLSPASPPARMLTMMQAITGTMYVAVLIARLVSVYTVEASDHSERKHNAPER
jgi:hypothetical protein